MHFLCQFTATRRKLIHHGNALDRGNEASAEPIPRMYGCPEGKRTLELWTTILEATVDNLLLL